MRVMFLILMLMSFSSTAMNVVKESVFVTSTEAISPYASLTPIKEVKSKVLKHIVDNFKISKDKLDSVSVQRIHVSNLFSVRVGKEYYIVDPTTAYWISSTLKDLYYFNKGVQRVNTSNEIHDAIMKMLPFLYVTEDFLPRYGEKDKAPIYAFMDLTCPHCKRFHLTEREGLVNSGISIVYVPLLRDVQNKKSRKINRYAYCAPSSSDAKKRINTLYLQSNKKQFGIIDANEKCDPYREEIYDFFLNTGERYGLIGSPMFLMPSGAILYGYPALKNYLNKKI